MPFWILDLRDNRALDPALTGGKGASLAWLRRHRFRVPPGFVITSSAFSAFLATPSGGVYDRDQLIAEAEQLLCLAPLPADLERAIRQAYRRLERGAGGRVAVRSSLLGEDSATRSYAGQLQSVLNVTGEEAVVEAVRQVWASAFGEQARPYRQRMPEAEQTDSPVMAVVVQQMVNAVAAGVAFSADPISGRRCVIVEAVKGLGDRLVQGLAEPDRFMVDERGVVVQECLVGADSPSLAEVDLLGLAQIVRDIARGRGQPQDVEWAWNGSQFYILQARPVTALVGRHVYSSSVVADMAPGLVRPLVYSINTVGKVGSVFGQVFTELIGPNDYDFTQLVRRIHSRVYADVTLLGELCERTGLPANFIEMMSRDEQAQVSHPQVSLRMLPALFRLTRFAWRQGRPAEQIWAFLAEHEQFLSEYQTAEWSRVGIPDLQDALDRLIAHHTDLFWHTFCGQMAMMVRMQILAHWVRRRTRGVAPGDLVRGLIGLKALGPNAELRRLAGLARDLDPGLLAGLAARQQAHSVDLLAASVAGRRLLDGVDDFLGRYGHLSSNGMDFTEVPWAENPNLIWSAIAREACSPVSDDRPDVALLRDTAQRKVRQQLNWGERSLFDRLLRSTVTYIGLREHLSDRLSHDAYQMRRLVLALADQLTGSGCLSRREDVFYLTYQEVRDLASGRLAAHRAQELAAAGRNEMAIDATVDVPSTLCGDHVPALPARLTEGRPYLSGIAGSSGRVQGYARVVMDPLQAPADLGPSDILVVPFTDVGWTPLFPGVAGIVAETGGQLSHTSIVAREYGLPAVVSVRQATRQICEGQPITIDGDQGRVYLQHLAPA